MKVGDVMTHQVVSVTTHTSLVETAQLMLKNRISGLTVIDAGGKLVGIVTDGDSLRPGEIGTQRHRSRWLELLMGPGRLADEYVHTAGREIGEVMNRHLYTVMEDTSLEESWR